MEAADARKGGEGGMGKGSSALLEASVGRADWTFLLD